MGECGRRFVVAATLHCILLPLVQNAPGVEPPSDATAEEGPRNASADVSSAASQEHEGCCSQIATLQAKLAGLEQRLAALEAANPVCTSGDSAGLPPTVPVGIVQGIPDYYKLKDKAPERAWLNIFSWFYISFDVYAGDRYLGEFRQSMPWTRLVWDEICFYDAAGDFDGQLYFGAVRWFLGIPNPFFGARTAYLRWANGTVPLIGAKESILRSLSSAERRSLDFSWLPTGVSFKSRKTVEVKGQQEWVIEEATGRGKVADIQESIIHDMWGRRFRGWTVTMRPGKTEVLDPMVPGYFAAYDLAEAEDSIPLVFGSILAITIGSTLFAFLRE